jgi:hypothetical protein
MTTREKQFAIIEVYDRPPAGAIAVGSMSAVMEPIIGSKAYNDAAARAVCIQTQALDAEQQRADAVRARDAALEEQREAEGRKLIADITRLSDAINTMSARLDALEEHQARQVAADKAQRIRDALENLGIGDGDEEPTHHPSGELHSIAPIESRYPAGDDGELPEPKDPSGVSIPPAHHFNVDRR